MIIFRLLMWISMLVVLVVVAAILYLSFADLNWLRPRIETAVADATGRKLTLEGRFDLAIVPSPAIVLEDVSLSNAEWGTDRKLARIGHFSARLGWRSLLPGPVRIEDFRMSDVDVSLEVNQQNEGNWTMRPQAGSGQPDTRSETQGGVPIIIESAEIRRINVSYQGPDAKPLAAVLTALDITTDQTGYTVLDGQGEVGGMPLTLVGRLGPGQALASGTDIGIDLDSGLGNIDLKVDGIIADLATLSGVDMKLVADSDEVAQVLEHFGAGLPLTGALHMDASVRSVDAGTRFALDARAGAIATTVTATRTAGAVSFEAAVPALDKVGAALEIDGLPAGDLAIEGRALIEPEAYRLEGVIARLGKVETELDGTVVPAGATALSIRAGGPSLAALNAGLPTIPFKASMTVNMKPERLVVDAIQTTFGESDLAGRLDASMGARITVTGKFSSQRLDLTPFAGAGEETDKGKKPAPEAGESKYVFVEAPLPFGALNKADVDIDANIDRLTLSKIVLLDVSAGVDLKDGGLRVKNRFAGADGGRFASELLIATAGDSAELDLNIDARDLRLNLISGDIEDKSLVPPISLSMNIQSTGGSPRALASSTNGRVLLTQGAGQIDNNLVSIVSGDIFAELFSALNPFSKEDPVTTTDCTILALDISDGKGDIAELYSQGDKIKVVGKGKIDLDTEKLDIEFNTKPRKGVGVSVDMFVTPFVKLKGTLASPSIAPDTKGVLLAVGTSGLSVVAQAAADRVAGEKDECARMLEKVGDHPPIEN